MPYRNSTFTLYIEDPPGSVGSPPYNERTLPGFTMVSVVPGRVELSCPIEHQSDIIGWRARVVQFPYGAAQGTTLFTGRITSLTTQTAPRGLQTITIERVEDPRTAACVICGQRGCRHTHADLSGHQYQPTGPSDEENWLTRARAEPLPGSSAESRPFRPYAGGSSVGARMQHYQDAVAAWANAPFIPTHVRGVPADFIMMDDLQPKLSKETLLGIFADPGPSEPRTAWQRLLDEDDDPSV